jgi:hypothetical protein
MGFRFKIICFVLLFTNSLSGFSQDVNRTLANGYDPNEHKIIPDKVFEIGLPLLFIYLIANTLVSIFKTRYERRLKEKAIDKGISENALIALFAEDKKLSRMVYIKWFLVLAALGVSLILIHSFASYFQSGSEYLALGIISLLQAIAFLIYYQVIRNR